MGGNAFLTPAALAKNLASSRPELQIQGTQRTRSRLRKEMMNSSTTKKPRVQNVFQAQPDDKRSDFVLPEFAEIQVEEADPSMLKDFRQGTESNRNSSRRKQRKTWRKPSEMDAEEVDNVHDHYLLSFNKKAHQRVDSKVQSIINLIEQESELDQEKKRPSASSIMGAKKME